MKPPRPARLPVRLLVWNLFHGRAVPGAGRSLRDEFSRHIAGWEWDVALLQEVPPWWAPTLARAAGAQQRTALTSRNSGLWLRRALAERWPDQIKSNGGGANAVLVRGQISDYRRLALRRRPERRVAQMVRTGDGVCVINLHASARVALAREELELVWRQGREWAAGAPLIVGGDLNLRDPRAPTPDVTHVAQRDVDHVFASRLALDAPMQRPEHRLADHPETLLSDHPPLLVALRPGP